MKGEFKILNNGNVIEYSDYNDIPTKFDNLISFKPYWPEPPHTKEDHALIETFNDKLKELMKREKN
jgi:hypothetical protein